jgi:hypothetical protein
METEEYGGERDEKGKFQKGNQAAKSRGPNKVSMRVKESIVNFLEKTVDAIQESFDTLTPLQKIHFLAEILPYATPKLSSVQSEVEQNIQGGITIRWEDPDVQAGQDQSST